MDITDPHCHTSSCRVAVPAATAFAYVSDGLKQSEWALGSLERKQVGDGLFVGRSIFNEQDLYVRIDADPDRLLVIYHIGVDRDRLVPRNIVRVFPGELLGRTADSCVVSLLTWRSADMDDDRWLQTCVAHETEMFIIRNRLERGARSAEALA